jgi:Zn-dependent protease with chaperone function
VTGPRRMDDSFETLYERIERNRRRFRILAVLYVLAVTVFFAVLILASIATVSLFGLVRIGEAGGDPSRDWGTLVTWVLVGTPLLVLAYTGVSLLRSERAVLGYLGADRAAQGVYRTTKQALYDMSIAAGYDRPPPLYMLDTAAVNACVIGRKPRSGVVAVTRGFAARFDLDEQRAVFAHLLVKLRARETLWATASTVLMHPLWIWKRRYYDVKPFEPAHEEGHWSVTYAAGPPGREAVESGEAFSDMRGDSLLLFPPYTIAVVAAHYMFRGQRESHLHAAEFADAEGMLLLKDPRAMVAALEKMVFNDNHVRTAGGQYTQFFFAWSGEDSSNDEHDPEYRRLERMRELTGVTAEDTKRNVRRLLDRPPPAPRIEG